MVVVAVSTEPEKFAIEIEAIKTPKGLVPTVESLKRVVQGLNRGHQAFGSLDGFDFDGEFLRFC